MSKQNKAKSEYEKSESLPIPSGILNRPCAAGHFGPWSIEPKWFANTVSAIKKGILKPLAAWDDGEDDGEDDGDR